MTSVMDGQVSLFDLDSWSGRTSPARSAATEERTSALFWRRLSELPNQNFLFLDCRKNKNGQKPEQSSVMDGLLRGELTTLNIGECPNAVVESRLSQILEANAPQKYLSAKACQGILNRANRRGKKLPEILEMALKSMIEWQNTTTPCKSEADALGGGKGALIQTDKSATIGCGNTQTLFQRKAIPFQQNGVSEAIAFAQNTRDEVRNLNNVSGCLSAEPGMKQQTYLAYTLDCRNAKANDGISGTLQAKESGGFSYNCVNPVAYIQEKTGCLSPGAHAGSYNGQDAYNDMLITEQKCYGISAYESNAMKSGNPHSGIYEADTARTLDLNGGSPACNQGGMAVCESYAFKPQQGAAAKGVGWQKECSPTLSSVPRGFPSPAVVHEAQAVFDARGNGDGSIAPTITGDHENRITDYTAVLTTKIIRWIVRRLTPLECERLQGFPDGWTDIGDWTDSKGKKHNAADTPRYKALGNSIALPFWYWMFKQMEKYLPEEATLGSLFDGIGGFPLCWEQIHGKGTARWASEIEEFPIAVTKYRFGED